ncbi:MAG: hypothetical protein L6R42_000060 [Xanthoria sp. 1 TBL-2021]|nr:MAG: hypothetical protein L6R42_000060 [Xanthoria sp. 1 TBL-2021]
MRLEVLSYERLKARDDDEISKLVRICSNAGIFFLDLRGPSTKEVLADMPPIIAAQRNFFAQSSESKLAYDNFDELAVQRLKLSREEQIQGNLSLPADLQAVEARLANVVSFNDSVLRDISTLLCKSLDPPIAVAAIKDPKNPGLSNLCLGLAAAPAGTPLLGSHLDEDMLTITYYDEPFLEVLDTTSEEWRVVEVFENLPIVNVGDRFPEASNDRLYAPLHRVVQTPREINLIMYDLNEGEE